MVRAVMLSLAALALAACGDSGTELPEEPPEVTFGETTFVVVVNPAVNAANQATVPAPGAARIGVIASVAGGPTATTDASGVAVLRPVSPGNRTIAFSAAGAAAGQLSVSIADRDLREIAVSTSPSGAQLMADVQYAFGGQVVEVQPSMTTTQVNAELARSNLIVFFRSGTYSGNLVFGGSNVTLFGEGSTGGTVTINGNVTVSGSRNRMRGARIAGSLSVPGSDFGMSFSRVAGAFQMAGSSGVLLNNAFCGTVTISGSGARLLGNAGLAPVSAPAGGC